MDNFIGYFRKVTTNRLKVNSQLEIGNKAIFAGTGTTYYVDSDASNAADTNSGRSWAKPLATIDGAINKCTANQGDTIILAESHSETYTTTGAKFVADVAGITIIGLGEGSDRATLTFSHTGATATISAANVSIYNVLFVTGIDSVVTYATISGADCKLINCETRDAAAKEVIDAFTVTTTASRFKAYGHKHIGDVSTGDASESIFNLTDVSDFEIEKCIFMTLCGTGVIELASTGVNGVVSDCIFYVAGTSDLSLNVVDTDDDSTVVVKNCFDLEAMSNFSGGNAGSGFSVAGDDVGAVSTALATVDTVVDAIKAVTDNLPNSGALTDLATAASLATVDTVVDAIKAVTDNLPNSGALTDLATAANLSTVDTVVDAIKAVTDNLPDSGALTALLSSIASILEDTGTTLPAQITSKIPDIVIKSVSSIANGNTNLFSITGEVEIETIYGLVTTGTEDAACTYKFDITDGSTDTDICTATSIQNKAAGTNLTISGTFSDALAVTAGNVGQGQARKINLSGEGTGYIRGVSSAAITGEVTFYCKYKKLSSDGAVAAV